MIVVHVLRKPIPKGSTVAKNALEHGTGSINIDASRIGSTTRSASNKAGDGNRTTYGSFMKGKPSEVHNYGRWPSNFILEHKAGCVCVGEKKVKTSQILSNHANNRDSHISGKFMKGISHPGDQGYADENGQEAVPEWECEAGCPVATLEAQAESSRFFKQVQEDREDEADGDL